MSSPNASVQVMFSTKISLDEQLWEEARDVRWISQLHHIHSNNISDGQKTLMNTKVDTLRQKLELRKGDEFFKGALDAATTNRSKLYDLSSNTLSQLFAESVSAGEFDTPDLIFAIDDTDNFVDTRLDPPTADSLRVTVESRVRRSHKKNQNQPLTFDEEFYSPDGRSIKLSADQDVIMRLVAGSLDEVFWQEIAKRPEVAKIVNDPSSTERALKVAVRPAGNRALHEWRKTDRAKMSRIYHAFHLHDLQSFLSHA